MKRLFLGILMCWMPLAAFEGFYVGGALGAHLAEATQSSRISGTISGIQLTPSIQSELFDRGITGMLYTGYGLRWCSLYLAAEGFVQFESAHMRDIQQDINLSDNDELFHIPGETKAHINCCQGGVDLLPGWSPDCVTLLYGRIGVSFAQTSLKTRNTNVGTSPEVGSWNLPLEFSKSKTSAAFRAGAGLEQSLTQRLTLRVDYIYTDYGKLSVHGFRTGTTTNGTPVTVRNDTSLHLYDHAVLLGLSYHFTCLEPIRMNCCCPHNDYNGFYVGGAIGGGNINANQHGSVVTNRDVVEEFQMVELPSQIYNDQFQGMLFLGYGRFCKYFYLGAELIASGATNQSMNFDGESSYTFGTDLYRTTFNTTVESSSWQWGFDFRPGVRLAPLTLLYGRVGVSAAEINGHSNALNNGNFVGLWAVPVKASESTWKATFRLGLGIEHVLSSRLHLRADYIFTNFGIVSFKSTAIGEDSMARQVTVTNMLSSHLQNHAVVAGISYYFHH